MKKFLIILNLIVVTSYAATITPSGTLTAGFCKHGYTVQLSTTGLIAPVTFSLTAGSLPPGVTLSTAGLIQGFITTTADAAYTFTLSAKGTGTVVATSTNTINVTAITDATLEQMWKYWTNPTYPTSSQVFDTWSSLLNGINRNLTPPYYKDSIVTPANTEFDVLYGGSTARKMSDNVNYGQSFAFIAQDTGFNYTPNNELIFGLGFTDWSIAKMGGSSIQSNNVVNGNNFVVSGYDSVDVRTKLNIQNGDVNIKSAGKTLKVKGGANTKLNSFNISGASAAVTNTVVTANSIIFLQETGATTPVAYSVTGITPGASFTVTPATSHTATVNYFIIEKQ